MRLYKRYFDKTKCMYLIVKDETFFAKNMKIWKEKKLSNIAI